MEKQAKGKNFLLVIGILLIIGAAIGVFTAFGLFATVSMMNSTDPQMVAALQPVRDTYALQGVTLDMLPAMAGFAVAGAVLNLVAAIIGIKNRKRTDKAMVCIVMGIILIVFVFADAAFGLANGVFSVFGVAFSLILPILYLVGAALNKSSEEA